MHAILSMKNIYLYISETALTPEEINTYLTSDGVTSTIEMLRSNVNMNSFFFSWGNLDLATKSRCMMNNIKKIIQNQN